jgi:hypothetical protein
VARSPRTGPAAVGICCPRPLHRPGSLQTRLPESVANWMEEYRLYHRDGDGRVVDENDDAISASRYGLMMRRFGRTADFKFYQPIQYPKLGSSKRGLRRPLGSTGTNSSDPNWECGRGRLPPSLTPRAIAVSLGPANKAGLFFGVPESGSEQTAMLLHGSLMPSSWHGSLYCTEAESTEPRRTTHPDGVLLWSHCRMEILQTNRISKIGNCVMAPRAGAKGANQKEMSLSSARDSPELSPSKAVAKSA